MNGSLHIHILLWNANAPNSNELVQKLKNDEQFKIDLLKYLENIISQNILNCDPKIKNEMNEYMGQQDIHPCSTRPPYVNDINFNIQFQQDFHKLMNVCNRHKCNLACYKNNKD